MPQPPTRLVVDTDPGVDDAVALAWLLTQSELRVDLIAISTVAGNTTVEHATANARAVLAAAGRTGVPVVPGAAAPLSRPLAAAPHVHGEDGLWGAGGRCLEGGPPTPKTGWEAEVADLYRAATKGGSQVTLLALGPLTNLASVLARHPDVLRRFDGVLALGGARHGGNVTPLAEFNVWHDPEAAAAVLGADLPITLVPLDAFAEVRFDQQDAALVAAARRPAARLLARPLALYLAGEDRGDGTAPIPELVAAMLAVDPSLGDGRPARVQLATEDPRDSPHRGRTIIDLDSPDPNTVVVVDVDAAAVRARFLRALGGYPNPS